MSQRAENTIRIPSPNDEEIVRFYEEIVKKHNVSSSFSISIAGLGSGEFKSFSDFEKKMPGEWKNFKIISSINLTTPGGISFIFNRKPHLFSNGGKAVDDSSFESEIYVYPQNQNPENINAAIIFRQEIEKLRFEISLSLPKSVTEVTLSNLFSQQIHELTELQTKILRDTEEYRQRSDQRLDERRLELETDILEEKRKSREELDDARRKISEELENINNLKKELDDRSHMHARRDMRNNITSTLKKRLEKPSVSKEIKNQRDTITGVCVLLIIIFLLSAGLSSWEFYIQTISQNKDSTKLYTIAARLGLSFLAMTAVAFYLLGWLKQTHNDDLRTERDLERYLYDVDRSSWVIETVLEAQARDSTDDQAEIPADWLKGVTHGLFARTEEKPESDKAMEILASLFNFSAKAKLGPQGPEFELNKSGLRKFGKVATEDE